MFEFNRKKAQVIWNDASNERQDLTLEQLSRYNGFQMYSYLHNIIVIISSWVEKCLLKLAKKASEW